MKNKLISDLKKILIKNGLRKIIELILLVFIFCFTLTSSVLIIFNYRFKSQNFVTFNKYGSYLRYVSPVYNEPYSFYRILDTTLDNEISDIKKNKKGFGFEFENKIYGDEEEIKNKFWWSGFYTFLKRDYRKGQVYNIENIINNIDEENFGDTDVILAFLSGMPSNILHKAFTAEFLLSDINLLFPDYYTEPYYESSKPINIKNKIKYFWPRWTINYILKAMQIPENVFFPGAKGKEFIEKEKRSLNEDLFFGFHKKEDFYFWLLKKGQWDNIEQEMKNNGRDNKFIEDAHNFCLSLSEDECKTESITFDYIKKKKLLKKNEKEKEKLLDEIILDIDKLLLFLPLKEMGAYKKFFFQKTINEYDLNKELKDRNKFAALFNLIPYNSEEDSLATIIDFNNINNKKIKGEIIGLEDNKKNFPFGFNKNERENFSKLSKNEIFISKKIADEFRIKEGNKINISYNYPELRYKNSKNKLLKLEYEKNKEYPYWNKLDFEHSYKEDNILQIGNLAEITLPESKSIPIYREVMGKESEYLKWLKNKKILRQLIPQQNVTFAVKKIVSDYNDFRIFTKKKFVDKWMHFDELQNKIVETFREEAKNKVKNNEYYSSYYRYKGLDTNFLREKFPIFNAKFAAINKWNILPEDITNYFTTTAPLMSQSAFRYIHPQNAITNYVNPGTINENKNKLFNSTFQGVAIIAYLFLIFIILFISLNSYLVISDNLSLMSLLKKLGYSKIFIFSLLKKVYFKPFVISLIFAEILSLISIKLFSYFNKNFYFINSISIYLVMFFVFIIFIFIFISKIYFFAVMTNRNNN